VPRGSFSDLSESYRTRLERGGITRESYESGASLSAARGHAATPERPLKDLENPPERYREYAEIRKEVAALKKELYGSSENFKEQGPRLLGKSRANLEKAARGLRLMVVNSWSLAELREEYPEYDSPDWDWLGYYH